MQLIYCRDEKIKNQLIADGYEYINEQIIDGKKTWIFKQNNKIKFDKQVDRKLVYF